MANVAEFQSFKLKECADTADFLLATDRFNREFLSKQKGYISYKVFSNGDTWYDLLVWESAEDIGAAAKAYKSYENNTDKHYISFIDEASQSEILHLLAEKEY